MNYSVKVWKLTLRNCLHNRYFPSLRVVTASRVCLPLSNARGGVDNYLKIGITWELLKVWE